MPKRLSLEDCQRIANEKGGMCLSTEYVNRGTHMKWRCYEGHEWSAVLNHIKYSKVWCPTCSGKAKLTLEECQQIAKDREGICLSTEYINIYSTMDWKCKHGHIWNAGFGNVKKGTWCPTCAGLAQLTLNECQQHAEHRGGVCLSTEYVNTTTKMKWMCKEGHEWIAKFGDIKHSNSWCPTCADTKLTLDECQQIAKDRGGMCLSIDYVNSNTAMKWRCAEGHEWVSTFVSIKNNNHWCLICSGNAKHDLEECHEIAKERGGECLSTEYVNNKTPINWRCKEGHEWRASFGSIKNKNHWCAVCSGVAKHDLEICQEIAKERGGFCLSTEYINTYTYMDWRCKEGHEWRSCFRSVKNGNSWCPKCTPTYSKLSTVWLILLSNMKQIDIQHSENEFKIPGTRYSADGYCQETNTIYEFHGDFWHGNPTIYVSHEYNPVVKKTFGELYEKTLAREQTLRSLGYNVVSIWESEWKTFMKIVIKIQRIVKQRSKNNKSA